MSLEAIEMLSDFDRLAYANRLALELLQPIPDAPSPELDEAFVPVRLAPPPWVKRRTKHGTLSGYTAGCRCNTCREANSAYKRQWTKRKQAEQNNTLADLSR